MKYVAGDVVWLIAEGDQPRELAHIIRVQPREIFTVEVFPVEDDPEDDGLREVLLDTIEGIASDEEKARFLATYKRSPEAEDYLRRFSRDMGINL